MALRYDDRDRTLSLSVLDLVDAGASSGHLVAGLVRMGVGRLVIGREVHEDWASDRSQQEPTFRPEVRLRQQIGVLDWTVTLHGRVDGLSEEGGARVVEEVKSTSLDGSRLYDTGLADWPGYVAQLEVYLWMVATLHGEAPLGRLVLVSAVDGSRQVLGVKLDGERVSAWVKETLTRLVEDREKRLAWLSGRRGAVVPLPFAEWREGQERVVDGVTLALTEGRAALVEAPTGLGKTAAVLYAVLRQALATDRQVFWATARTTQQEVVARTAARLRAQGLALRTVVLSAREKACLNEVVACRPDACAHARLHYEKVRAGDLVEIAPGAAVADRERLRALGTAHQCCPYELGWQAVARADLVIGDLSYAIDAGAPSPRLFGGAPGEWILVADEAHHVPERAREQASPRVDAAAAEAARARFAEATGAFAFYDLARDVADAVTEEVDRIEPRGRDGAGAVEPSKRRWRDLAERVESLGPDFARLALKEPVPDDPWPDLADGVRRFAAALDDGSTQAVIGGGRGSSAWLRALCLDPSPWLGPRLAGLGGVVLQSATLSPASFYRDLLGLSPEGATSIQVGSPFPRERRRILIVPQVSTAYRDRAAEAPATAYLLERLVCATPGNVAVYFSSFEMLDDIVSRWSFEDREILRQTPSMSEAARAAWLARLAEGGRAVVVAAVLGGIFAEGIDLPPGALSAVLVVGPGLPPVGLERDLLRACYEERYGEGFRYAYLVPGMTRVVQGAGRLIRRPEDRGVVALVDKRFRQKDYRELLPDDWNPGVVPDPEADIRAFWLGTMPAPPEGPA